MPINFKFNGSLDCFSDVSSFLRKRDCPVLSLTLIFLLTPPHPSNMYLPCFSILLWQYFLICSSCASQFNSVPKSCPIYPACFIEICHFYAYSEFIAIRPLACCACKKKCLIWTSKKNVDGRCTSSHENKRFKSRSVVKQKGMVFGFQKTATAVTIPER